MLAEWIQTLALKIFDEVPADVGCYQQRANGSNDIKFPLPTTQQNGAQMSDADHGRTRQESRWLFDDLADYFLDACKGLGCMNADLRDIRIIEVVLIRSGDLFFEPRSVRKVIRSADEEY